MENRVRFLKPTLLVGALAFAFAGVAPAQKDDAKFAELRDKKLELAFLKKASWTTDYDAALADAKKNGKLIFAYFTRSYAK
jgi:hypothetical protein